GLGLLNAIAIAGLRIPTLIATLGTQGIIRGAMLLWVGSKVIPHYPAGLDRLGNDYLVTVHSGAAATRLSVLIIPAAVICVLVGLANPYELVGGELDVIAAVVLGGASIFGGSGSVTGTVLGVVLITLVKNSLILLGVPSTWQRFAVGLLLLVGITAQALSARL